ncbi:EamA family transporter [Curtobacterium luteum]|uniref:EamA family transporter n=1 Tax=Curtobacterium luteum TaxID=33881 RepID=UPI0038065058
MLTVVLGLSGALVYGFADFLGGVASRRVRPVVVTAVAALVGIVPLAVGLVVVDSAFSGRAVVWGAVAGLAGGVAVLLLYTALAIGPMSVLSPVTAVFAACVPVVVAVLRGTALSPLAVGMLVVAVVAVVLVASVRDTSGARLTARGVAAAAVAGCGFGGIVLAYDMTPADSGVAPLVVARVLQVVLLGVAAVVVVRRGGGVAGGAVAGGGGVAGGGVAGGGGPFVRPAGAVGYAGTGRPGGTGRLSAPAAVGRVRRLAAGRARWSGRLVATVVACGFFDALANVFVQAGLHSSDDPLTLPVMSVLNALYPIGTVVLAGVVLRERLTPLQLVGIVLAFGASVGLALV